MTRIALLLVTGAMTIACHAATGPHDFGAHYRVVWEPEPPVLEAASFSITVSYGACGSNREFALQHASPRFGEVDVWLRKVSPNEPCDVLVTERRVFFVPQTVRDAAVVTLLAPNDNPYLVRP